MTRDRLIALIEQIDQTPFGPAESALTREAIALAIDLGDEQLEYAARLRQTSSANHSGDIESALTSFAWCLARHDEDPVRFPAEVDGADLMWQFKWMASMLSSSPEFGLDQIEAVLDDMEQHYRAGGLGISGVLMARFEHAWDAGRFEEADRTRSLLLTTPRDEYSHCFACTPSQLAGYAIERGDDVEALRLIDEMIAEEHTCGEEPEHALARSLGPALRTGRLDDAREAHLRSYRLAKDNPANLGIIAHHIVFCAVTGNEARALSLIERHLRWLAHDALDAAGHVRALSAIAVGLDAVTAAGHGDTPVRGADDAALRPWLGAPPAAGWTAASLAERAWTTASELSARFDARNGTSAYADRLVRLRAFGAQRFDVPLRGDAFVPTTVETVPVDGPGRVRRALELISAGAGEAAAAAEAALPHAEGDERTRLLAVLVLTAIRAGDDETAQAWLAQRDHSLRDAGRAAQADLEHRYGLRLWRRGDDVDLTAIEQAVAETADPAARGWAHLTRALVAIDADDHTTAATHARAARDLAEAAGDGMPAVLAIRLLMYAVATAEESRVHADELLTHPRADEGLRVKALQHRARVRMLTGDAEGAQHDADAAVVLAGGIGAQSLLPELLFGAAGIADGDGRPTDAAARLRRAADLAEGGGNAIGLRYRLAQTLLDAGAPDDAADAAAEVLAAEEAAEAPPAARAETLVLLARALEAAGEPGRAVGAWAYAAELFAEAELPARQASALVFRAKLLLHFDVLDDAAIDATTALALARPVADADPSLLLDALHTLGRVRDAQQDPDAFGLYDEAAALATAHDAGWALADITDSRARAHAQRGEIDLAVAAALRASDLFAAAADPGSASMSELVAARSLVSADRAEDAVAVFRGVLDRPEAHPRLRAMAALDLGDALESLGRLPEAAAARALAEE